MIGMTRFVSILAGLLVSVAVAHADDGIKGRIEAQIDSMTLKQKVCQMFIVRPESLTQGEIKPARLGKEDKGVTLLDSSMLSFHNQYPVGGFCLFSHNIETPEQTVALNAQLHSLAGSPLICVDEEGGRVARIARNPRFGLKIYSSAASVASGGADSVHVAGKYIGTYVREYGFDVDFAPVADVNTNPNNPIIGSRAYDRNPDVCSEMAVSFLNGLESAGVIGCLKHFPGHGDVKGDTHTGFVASGKTWDEISSCEMKTFRAGIGAGARMVMVAHIAVPNVTGSNVPSTMSRTIVTEKLREELGFNGVIITDAMEMGAIIHNYGTAEATVAAVKAGVDIILMPLNLQVAVDAVIDAVQKGEITVERIDSSVRRILELKYDLKQNGD